MRIVADRQVLTIATSLPRRLGPGAVPTRRRHLLVSIGCAVLFVGVYLVAVRTAVGQKVDDRAFQLLFSLAPPSTIRC